MRSYGSWLPNSSLFSFFLLGQAPQERPDRKVGRDKNHQNQKSRQPGAAFGYLNNNKMRKETDIRARRAFSIQPASGSYRRSALREATASL